MEKKRLHIFSIEDDNDVNVEAIFAIGPVKALRALVEQRMKRSGSLLSKDKFEKFLFDSINEMVIMDCESMRQEDDAYHNNAWQLLQRYMLQNYLMQ